MLSVNKNLFLVKGFNEKPKVVVFLDIDSILFAKNKQNASIQERGKNLDPAAVANLDTLIKAIENHNCIASIVITSDWCSTHTIIELQKLFSQYSFAKNIVGKTCHSEDPSAKNFFNRAKVIQNWLHENTDINIKSFIILNAQQFKTADFSENFVLCQRGVFSAQDLENALEVLDSAYHISLIDAAKSGDISEFEETISELANSLNNTDSNNQTALLWAAARGHKEIVRILLEAGAALDARTQILSSSKAKINNKHYFMPNPMMHDSYLTPKKLAQYHNRSAVSWAVANGDNEIVELLLANRNISKKVEKQNNQVQKKSEASKKETTNSISKAGTLMPSFFPKKANPIKSNVSKLDQIIKEALEAIESTTSAQQVVERMADLLKNYKADLFEVDSKYRWKNIPVSDKWQQVVKKAKQKIITFVNEGKVDFNQDEAIEAFLKTNDNKHPEFLEQYKEIKIKNDPPEIKSNHTLGS